MFSRDFNENEFSNEDLEILNALLYDNSTKKNIIWATDNYKRKGPEYYASKHMKVELITGRSSKVIKPRVDKSKTEQAKRSKDSAEVFTPSWMCNKQNNLIDEAWFGYSGVFNTEKGNEWISTEKVIFKNDKSWKDYISDIRLEITCGEAPYIVSRYDTVTGNEIPINQRIGLLDRKLRVVNENVTNDEEWLEYAIKSIKSVYGYEYQGDNLLIARENILLTFIDYYSIRFGKNPDSKLLLDVAKIISWNFWQMDGIKMVVPLSCHEEKSLYVTNIFGESIDESTVCKGCANGNLKDHNGTRCLIMDWNKKKKVKFMDLMGGF